MVLIAKGRIDDTSAGTFVVGPAYDYLLAEDSGLEILPLLGGDSDYIGSFETHLVEVRGELAGMDLSGRYEILRVEFINRIDGNW